MKTITIFGLTYSQHIANFASALKDTNNYRLYALNNNPNVVQGQEYYDKARQSFENITEVKRSKNVLVDLVLKILTPLYYIYILAKKSDVVQFNYISYLVLGPALIVKLFTRARVSMFIYGSDFLRAGKLGIFYLRVVFLFADSIVCDSSTVLDSLKVTFPRYASKMHCCYFGSIIIDKLVTSGSENRTLFTDGGKVRIMCGYNGKCEQQHLKILEALDTSVSKYRWIIPMTYGGSREYKEQIISQLEKYKADYSVLDHFLSEDEWISYIKETDVFIHMQETDAFSAALSEHLVLGHIVINGSWLPYKDFDNNEVYYISSDFNNLRLNLEEAIESYEDKQNLFNLNKEKIVKIKGLNYCITNYWIPYFENI